MLERARRLFRFLGLELDHVWHVIVRVAVGCYNDGLIHAGNLAYMSMLAIFPFFVTGAAVFSAFGEDAERMAAVSAVLTALPPLVSDVIGPVAKDVVELRSGWLLWIGGVVGLWTAGSLMETIRDILRRAYGTEPTRAFWWYRLFSTGFIILVMFLLMLTLFVQVTIGAAMQVISAYFPEFTHAMGELAWSRIIPALGLLGSIYLVFYTLTPKAFRLGKSPKWPGALLVTLWWALVSELLPRALRQVFSYDLTYGSLAGMMITLFFFWLVGLGMVAGAELNAALADPSDNQTGGQSEANRDATKLEEIA